MKSANKQEQRLVEERFLQPEKIPAYTGPSPILKEIHTNTVKIMFRTTEEMEAFSRQFRVSGQKELFVNDIRPIMAFVTALENGSLVYEKEHDTITIAP